MNHDGSTDEPQVFHDAVASMHEASLRKEISMGSIRPPQRLAPYSYAVGLEVDHEQSRTIPRDTDGDAFGRLILLHDPRSDGNWSQALRLVAYIQADMDPEVASDPLLPDVAWQWLSEGLTSEGAHYSQLGGTVTSTSSARYGNIGGPGKAYQIELRASWTADDTDLASHVEAFAHVLASVAGLPPEGVAQLGQ